MPVVAEWLFCRIKHWHRSLNMLMLKSCSFSPLASSRRQMAHKVRPLLKQQSSIWCPCCCTLSVTANRRAWACLMRAHTACKACLLLTQHPLLPPLPAVGPWVPPLQHPTDITRGLHCQAPGVQERGTANHPGRCCTTAISWAPAVVAIGIRLHPFWPQENRWRNFHLQRLTCRGE